MLELRFYGPRGKRVSKEKDALKFRAFFEGEEFASGSLADVAPSRRARAVRETVEREGAKVPPALYFFDERGEETDDAGAVSEVFYVTPLGATRKAVPRRLDEDARVAYLGGWVDALRASEEASRVTSGKITSRPKSKQTERKPKRRAGGKSRPPHEPKPQELAHPSEPKPTPILPDEDAQGKAPPGQYDPTPAASFRRMIFAEDTDPRAHERKWAAGSLPGGERRIITHPVIPYLLSVEGYVPVVDRENVNEFLSAAHANLMGQLLAQFEGSEVKVGVRVETYYLETQADGFAVEKPLYFSSERMTTLVSMATVSRFTKLLLRRFGKKFREYLGIHDALRVVKFLVDDLTKI